MQATAQFAEVSVNILLGLNKEMAAPQQLGRRDQFNGFKHGFRLGNRLLDSRVFNSRGPTVPYSGFLNL